MKKKFLFRRVDFFDMEEKNSQENAIETVETIETAIDINNGLSSELKSDILSRTKEHRGNIDNIIVSQYIDDQDVNNNNYAVTYSSKDKSILGWTVNIEENGQQQPDVYFKFDKEYNHISSFVLYKKTLILRCYNDDHYCKYLLRTSKYTLKGLCVE